MAYSKDTAVSRDIVICGFGGLCAEIDSLIADMNRGGAGWNILGCVAPSVPEGGPLRNLAYLGDDTYLLGMQQPCAVVLAVGSPAVRKKIAGVLRENSFLYFPSLIHPAAMVDENAKVGAGSVLSAYSVVKTGAAVGEFVFLNTAAILGHDAQVGHFSVLMPQANVLGSVCIGAEVTVGANSVIYQGLKVADRAVIGLGSVVLNHVPPAVTVLGNPAKVVYRHEAEEEG